MKVAEQKIAYGLSFKLEGHGSILQIFYHGELWTSINLLVQYQYIVDTVDRLKEEIDFSEIEEDELIQ